MTMVEELWCDFYSPCFDQKAPITCSQLVSAFNKLVSDSTQNIQTHCRVIALSGPTGCGKTTMINMWCMLKNVTPLTFTYDDNLSREGHKIKSDVITETKNFIQMANLVISPDEKRIIILDGYEIPACKQHKFIQVLNKISTTSYFPIVWILPENIINHPFPKLNFPEAQFSSIKRILFYIAKAENFLLGDSDASDIARHAKSDIRSAINMLQSGNVCGRRYNSDSISKSVGKLITRKEMPPQRHLEDPLFVDYLNSSFDSFIADPIDWIESAEAFSEFASGLDDKELLAYSVALSIRRVRPACVSYQNFETKDDWYSIENSLSGFDQSEYDELCDKVGKMWIDKILTPEEMENDPIEDEPIEF